MVQALHPSLCHPQTFCLSSLLCSPLTQTLCSQFLSSRLFPSQPYTDSFVPFPLPGHHPPTHSLSNTSFSSGFHADTFPPYSVSHNIPFSWTHRHPPSAEHMQSRGISFYCPYSPCNHTHLPFIHCNNTFGVEVVLLRAVTQSMQERQTFTPNFSYV